MMHGLTNFKSKDGCHGSNVTITVHIKLNILFQKNTVLWLAVNCMIAHYFYNFLFTWNRVTFKLHSDKFSFFSTFPCFITNYKKAKMKTTVVCLTH